MRKELSMTKNKIVLLLALPCFLASCGPSSSEGSTSSGGGSQTSSKDDATTITIYAGGSSEFAWRKGRREAEVYKAIEDRYYEDQGIRLKFNVEFLGQNMKQSITTGITDGSIDVIISHMGGGDGIDDWISQNGLYRNLTNDFEDYEYIGKNMKWNDGNGLSLNAAARVLTSSYETIAIPSVIKPYKFGILVRKDWMEACGFSDVEKEGYELVDNYEAFERMCLAMKERYNLPYTISGAIYEIEKTGILGAYGVPAGYYTSSQSEYKGRNIVDVGGLINKDYGKVLETESRWISNGILPSSPDDKKVDDCETDFIAEKTGVFLENPTVTHLIEVARLCKKENPEAEFTVLGALTKDEESTQKGFMRNSLATFGAVIAKNSPDYRKILSFVNWAYSSKENYELCRYGVKGIHYDLDEEGRYYYPEGFSYEDKPYSGILTLVENQLISDRAYAGFSEEELSWIEKAGQAENYLINDKVDYNLILPDKTLLNRHFANRKEMYNYTQSIWAGTRPFATADYETIVDNYLESTSDYSAAVYDHYTTLKQLAELL